VNERISGTLVFTDLAGFTAFTAERGDEAAVALVEQFESLVRGVLPRSGRVVKQLGDGLFLFVPDAAEAVAAMLSLADTTELASSPDAPLWVRTGIHAGTALPRGTDLLGHDVNVAARITDLAAAGEVLVSESARALAGLSVARFQRLAPAYVKGIAEPLRLFRATPISVPV